MNLSMKLLWNIEGFCMPIKISVLCYLFDLGALTFQVHFLNCQLKNIPNLKKSYDQPRQHIKKQRHYFANKGPSSQGYGFSSSRVWIWELDYKESWALKNWCLWTVVLEKTLEVPWTARRSNQSILKEISPEYSLEGLMLKLKLQYSGHQMQRTDSFEKTFMLGKIEGRRRRGWQRMRWLDGVTDSMDMNLGKLGVVGQGGLECCGPWGCKESDMTEWLNWTELKDWELYFKW